MQAVPRSRYFVFFSIAIVGCLVDLATKSYMFARLGMPGGATWWIWPDVFGFQTSLNEGALFGMGQGFSAVFAALSIVAAIGVLYWLFYVGAAQDWLLTIALGCVTAGIFGNLYDRLGLHGLQFSFGPQAGEPAYAVRDFIHVMLGSWPWPTFNIADSLLVCGAALLCCHAVFAQEPPESDTKKSTSSA